MAAVLVAVLLAGCGGDEPVRTPLTVEDLGPGDWAGPFADNEELEGAGRMDTCMLLGGIYFTAGHELLDEQLAYFGDGETRVKVRAQRYPPDDPDLAGRLASADRLGRCVVEEGSDRKPGVASATWWREPDGAVVYEEHTDRGPDSVHDYAIQIAMITTDEWFVLVEVSHVEGAEAPDALKLLDQAVANVSALPAPESDEA